MIRAIAVFSLVGLSCLVLAGCSQPGATSSASAAASTEGSCTLVLTADVPLLVTPHDRKLGVAILVNGTPLMMILDTGSEGLALTASAAARAGNGMGIGSRIEGTDEGRQSFVNGIGGSTRAQYLQIDRLDLGHLHGAFGAQVIPMQLQEDGQDFDGLLGMSLLGDFDIDMDLPGHRLRLYQTHGDCPKPVVAIGQPAYATPLLGGYMQELREDVDVKVNGQTLRARFDSGAVGTLIYGSAAARLGLSTTESDNGGPVDIQGVGGRDTVGVHRVATLAVGPLIIHNAVVGATAQNDSQVDMLLGLPFMRQVHVWFSNSSHSVVMQYPPQPSPPVQ